MKKLIIAVLLMLPMAVWSTNIKVENAKLNSSQGTVSFTLSWENAWKNSTNHDAAWVFVKFVNPNTSYTHGTLASTGHKATSANGAPQASLVLPSDRVGIFVTPGQNHRGNVTWQLNLKLERSVLQNLPANAQLEVYAIEMVYIPSGGFTLGDPDVRAINFASFYKSDAEGKASGLYEITAEDQEIQVGTDAGNLYYQIGRSPYRGDQKGLIPSTFPKGVKPFYMMKYETSQGLYVDFLNTISTNLAEALSPHQVKDYYTKRGTIKFENGRFIAESRLRPSNYITWDDGAALADWAGLRPMTELEFTKAARGPGKPIAHEFPWNTDNVAGLARKVELTDELTLTDNLSEANINNQNRHRYGASYYWVMDLAGSLWEKCVTLGHPIGRNFKGTHGDGKLSDEAKATNSDWPKGINEEGGYGYRGGGYYTHGMKTSEYNPHSPIAYRPYGSWAGGKKSIAYSQRYVRTAPQR